MSFPPINITFDPTDESVIVDSIPANGANGVEYQLEGYLNYEKVRIETFCYAPNVKPYDVPAKQAYIFNWGGDAEFLLPCTGDYKFTAYLAARYIDAQGNGVEEKGPTGRRIYRTNAENTGAGSYGGACGICPGRKYAGSK